MQWTIGFSQIASSLILEFQTLHFELNRTFLTEPSASIQTEFYRVIPILKFGVPQGSCLGPLLFSFYASKLFKIVQSHLPYDTQLYIAFRSGNDLEETAAITAMESCIADISQWMHSDKLKLNSDKTECLLIGTRQQLQKVSNISTLSVGDSQIAPSCEVRNLGTWFDSKMSMLSHINKTCSSAFYYLYNMRRIRKYLSRSVTESLVHAFITSRIDYCNSLLYGLPNSHIMKLQRIQNAAARLVTGTLRFCHVTPLLFHLHWLPISYRIKFTILLLTFKCLYGQAPNYLIDLISIKKQSRYSLRSNESSIFLDLPGNQLLAIVHFSQLHFISGKHYLRQFAT